MVVVGMSTFVNTDGTANNSVFVCHLTGLGMTTKQHPSVQRRTFLKGSAMGALAFSSGLAGCLGGLGGDTTDGGGQSNGAAQGDDGMAAEGTTVGGGPTPTTRIAMPPFGPYLVVWKYLEDNNILDDHMSEVGYDFDMTLTWEEIALGAAGHADLLPSNGSIEAARLGPTRGINFAVNTSAILTQYTGILVQRGGKYDPEMTGSVQASFDKLVDDGGQVAIGAWGGGDIPPLQMIVAEQYGYDFTEEGDFEVVVADYAALARLLDQGSIAAAFTAPPQPAAQMMPPNPFVSLLWIPHGMQELGFGQSNLALANTLSTQRFAEEHGPAIAAWVKAWHEGASWMLDQDPADLVQDDEIVQALFVETKEEAEFVLDWSLNFFDEPIVKADIEITDEYIETDTAALHRVQELGQVPPNWDDYVVYRKVPQT